MTGVCHVCDAQFDPEHLPGDPEVQAGLILARERYQDVGRVCGECLANRGRLAMMYDPSCQF